MATAISNVHNEVERQPGLLLEDARALFRASGTESIHQEMFEAGGKLLRPRVLLLSVAHGESTGGIARWELARRAALAIEVAHVGTLYHDDIVDRSPIRRGITAVHRRLGIRAASVGGAHLLSLGNAVFSCLPTHLVRRLGIAALREADGQLQEIERTGRFDVTPQEYIRIASKKTGSPFELAAFVGASLGGAGASDRSLLSRFGRQFGVAYQLFDDLDDFVVTAALHRPPLNDLRERVYTLPVLLGCAQPGALGQQLRELLRDDGRPLEYARATEVCELLRRGNAFEEAANRAIDERESARHWLELVSPSEPKESLGSLLARLDHRVFEAPGRSDGVLT